MHAKLQAIEATIQQQEGTLLEVSRRLNSPVEDPRALQQRLRDIRDTLEGFVEQIKSESDLKPTIFGIKLSAGLLYSSAVGLLAVLVSARRLIWEVLHGA